MIRRLRYRFILTASAALMIVLSFVVGVINGTMRAILDRQLDRVLNQLVIWDGSTDEAEKQSLHPELGTMLGNHFFRAMVDADGTVLALDLSNAVYLTETAAAELASSAFSGGRSAGRAMSEDTLYAYRVSAVQENGNISLVFLDCTPATNMVAQLLSVSFQISALSLVGFVLIFSLLSRRAVQPVLDNIEAQKRFITNASHELKTPLAIISANTELLGAMNGENEWTQSIESQVKRMTGLVNDLVVLSKLSERESVELRPVDLTALVTEASDAVAPLAKQRGKTLTREIAEGVCAEGDERMLQMLLSVLLDNAVKYCDEGGEIRVSLAARGGKKTVLLDVSNDYAAGAGADCSRFFERFYQEDQSHNSKKGGFGIGLSTAQELAALMRGALRADWRDGRITFRTTLNGVRGGRTAAES